MRLESCISAGLGILALIGLSAIVFSEHARARSGDESTARQDDDLRVQVQLLRTAVEQLNAQALSACADNASQRDPAVADALQETWHHLLSTGPLSRISPPLDVQDPLTGEVIVQRGN